MFLILLAQVAYIIVDVMHAEHPELVKDQFWDEVTLQRIPPKPTKPKKKLANRNLQGIPDELPYTVAAEEFRTDPWLGSTADVLVTEEQVQRRNLMLFNLHF